MVPTLIGRIQTRIFLLATVGSVLTALVTPVLPIPGPLGSAYKTTFIILAAVIVVGIVWEFVYQLLMQWRWEKDWPSMFGLVTALPEGAVIWALLVAKVIPGLHTTPPFGAFLADFATVWVGVWLVANGPMRVPFLRWRFHGGRVV
jgi:hypothetical protein